VTSIAVTETSAIPGSAPASQPLLRIHGLFSGTNFAKA